VLLYSSLSERTLEMKTSIYVKLCASIMALALFAQVSLSPVALAQQPDVPPAVVVVIPDGTELTVITTDEIDSKTAVEGDPLSFKVDEDVVVNGTVVIKKGALVKGIVSDSAKSGRMGKAGRLSIRVESTTTVDNQKLKLRAAKGKEGDDKTGTTVALVVLFGPLGFLKKGKNAKIKEGTRIKVFTDEEKSIQIAAKLAAKI
jgi:hypothetical protein